MLSVRVYMYVCMTVYSNLNNHTHTNTHTHTHARTHVDRHAKFPLETSTHHLINGGPLASFTQLKGQIRATLPSLLWHTALQKFQEVFLEKHAKY